MSQLIVGIAGTTLTEEERVILRAPLIHGVILFTRNYTSPHQLKELCAEIHAVKTPSLSIYVDQEGGRVQRFCDGFTKLPAPGEIPLHKVSLYGEVMAKELKNEGIDFSFAPSVDLNKESRVIGTRAFGTMPESVISRATAFIRGMQRGKMPAIIKHFPGHGTAVADTHLEMAADSRNMQALQSEDLKPFIHFIDHGVFGVMASHVIYSAIDAKPASLSRFWLTEVLRKQLGFKGKIYSDDLGMQAVARLGSPLELVKQCFAAGADYALLCNNWQAVVEVVRGGLR
jgi:beta-N-acetylhexosaminidase